MKGRMARVGVAAVSVAVAAAGCPHLAALRAAGGGAPAAGAPHSGGLAAVASGAAARLLSAEASSSGACEALAERLREQVAGASAGGHAESEVKAASAALDATVESAAALGGWHLEACGALAAELESSACGPAEAVSRAADVARRWLEAAAGAAGGSTAAAVSEQLSGGAACGVPSADGYSSSGGSGEDGGSSQYGSASAGHSSAGASGEDAPLYGVPAVPQQLATEAPEAYEAWATELQRALERAFPEAVELRQADFAHGPVRITRPGRYVLAEDVVFNPSGASAEEGHSGSSEVLGFFAAIIVEAPYVLLDLQGHELSQSAEHALLQRFFALVELADQPFMPGQGPANFGADIAAAEYVVVRNGVLGLSAHHGVHGNANSAVVLRDLVIRDFEVAAIQLNGGSHVCIMDCDMGPSRQDVPVLATYSQAVFARLAVQRAMVEAGPDETFRGKTGAELLADLDMLMAHPEDPLCANPFLNTDGTVYGLLLNSKGVAINALPTEVAGADVGNRHVYVARVRVHGLRSTPVESPVASLAPPGTVPNGDSVYGNGGAIMVGPFGDVFRAGDCAKAQDDSYVPDCLSDAQLYVAKCASHFGTSNIPQSVIDWAEGKGPRPEWQWIYGGDCMHHVMKGNFGVLVRGGYDVYMTEVEVDGVVNSGPASTLPRETLRHGGQNVPYYDGATARGIAFSGTTRVVVENSSVRNVRSEHGIAAGVSSIGWAVCQQLDVSVSDVSTGGVSHPVGVNPAAVALERCEELVPAADDAAADAAESLAALRSAAAAAVDALHGAGMGCGCTSTAVPVEETTCAPTTTTCAPTSTAAPVEETTCAPTTTTCAPSSTAAPVEECEEPEAVAEPVQVSGNASASGDAGAQASGGHAQVEAVTDTSSGVQGNASSGSVAAAASSSSRAAVQVVGAGPAGTSSTPAPAATTSKPAPVAEECTTSTTTCAPTSTAAPVEETTCAPTTTTTCAPSSTAAPVEETTCAPTTTTTCAPSSTAAPTTCAPTTTTTCAPTSTAAPVEETTCAPTTTTTCAPSSTASAPAAAMASAGAPSSTSAVPAAMTPSNADPHGASIVPSYAGSPPSMVHTSVAGEARATVSAAGRAGASLAPALVAVAVLASAAVMPDQ